MATYIRLIDYKDSDSKEQGFFKSENRYEAKQEDFEKIPGSPIAYWAKEAIKKSFENNLLGSIIPVKKGMDTGNNDLFLKLWTEVNFNIIGIGLVNGQDTITQCKKWIPYNKGGEFQKWYGNKEYIINWANDGEELKQSTANLRSQHLYFKNAITWNALTSNTTSARFSDYGALFDSAGSSMFPSNLYNFYLSFMNTKIVDSLLKIINPTLNYGAGTVGNLPIIFPKQESVKQQIDTLTQECIEISKEDWDSRETSWDFRTNELVRILNDEFLILNEKPKLEMVYNRYCEYWSEKFYKLHANEEELNRFFIDIYELGDELTPDVALKDITILKSESIINEDKNIEFKADEIMKQFISYAVGVMFGRYSLDKDGLQIANLGSEILISQMTDETKVSFPIDDDNVIPVLEDDYFSDDIASRVINFVKTTFGSESLSENINFIEKCLGKTIRAYMVKDFYEDHIKRYKKRPIYWMVSSPKKGFMSLSYMHRYTNDLFARVQNNYLREYITKLEGTKDILRQIIVDESASSKDKKDADKKIKDIENRLKELISFDRDVLTSYAQNRVDIDLDDGVKVNYNKFKEVLYPIKGLDKE